MECSHPNQIRGADGVLRCLTCGEEISKAPPDNSPRSSTTPLGEGGKEPEKKPTPKRTRKKTSSDPA